MSFWGQLSRKEVPFLVTVFIGIAGWAITHTVNRMLSAPTIEYRTITRSDGGETVVTATVINLSREAFYDLTFEIQAPEIQPCEVAFRSTPPALPSSKPPATANNAVAFTIDQLQPGWDMSMCARLKGTRKSVFVLKKAERQAIQLVQPSAQTYLAKHEFAVTVVLLILAALSIIAWVLCTEGKPQKEPCSYDRDW